MTQKTIAQRYVLNNKIGSGGMGAVYQGLNSQTEQIVAIKELHSNLTDDQLIERFKREGEALRELNHPNIVKMLDAVEEDGRHYLIMEFISGGDLSHLLQHGQLPVERILNISIDLADALTRAHRLNIIHRDLKPANILMGDDGILRLTDFGVAHVGSKARVTDTDAIVGTIDYLPPEAFEGSQFDERGDIWAFGVILFEMLTGKRPFAGETIMKVMLSITTESVPDIDELRPDTPVALIDLTYRMLERNVDARIRSVRQIGLELEDILQGRTTQAISQVRFDINESDIFAIKKHNLPVQSTPFVGREQELDELSKLIIDPSIRLITIIAPGGMGKTRLALEASERNLDQFHDGVYFVELAPLMLADQIIPAIGAALDYKFQQGEGDAKQELLEFLLNKQLLLVMDNFEHLLDGAELVGEILTKASRIQILVTSRQRLAQQGENVLHLSGLDFPDWETPDDALQYAAVKLFLNSAKRANPSFELTIENLADVARICKLLQGMPLGIVLSGAWMEMLTSKEIADELEQSMDILSDEVGELPSRQQSIRVVMDYAWQMMTEAEQVVFMTLSIFKGGFTREAAQAVASANLRTLMSLVTKSLIRRDTASGRYEIHELLRQYAYNKLRNSGNADEALRQHATYFSYFLVQQLPLLKGGGQLKALAAIDKDYENCYASWVWAVENNMPEPVDKMIDSLYLYLQFSFQFETGYKLFEMARQQWSLPTTESEHIAARLSIRFIGTDDRNVVLPIFEKALAVAQEHNDLAEVAFCQRELGRLLAHSPANHDKDLITRGIEHSLESLRLSQELGDGYLEAWVLDDIGYSYHRKADFDLHNQYAKQSIELRKQVGDFIGYGDCLNGYIFGIFRHGMEEPLRLLEEARELAYQTNNAYLLNMITPTFGFLYLFMGKFEMAFEASQTGYRLSLAAKNERWRLTGLFGMANALCLLNRDMELVIQYLQEVPPEGALIYQDSLVHSQRLYALTSYSTKTQDNEALLSVLQGFMRTWGRLGPLVQFIVFVPIFAYWIGRNKDVETAVQWLGFCYQYQQSSVTKLYYRDWSVIVNFQAWLRSELGNEKFDALWEAGRLLDKNTVYQQVLEEFGSES